MLGNQQSCSRLLVSIFHQSRRSFTPTRQLTDLEQIYQLLKNESLCKWIWACGLADDVSSTSSV